VHYYIFTPDLVGYAMLGALCNAVKRGVDVRMMVDSLGSFSVHHNELRALETCAEEAGFIRNADGQITTRKARVQVVIFNALSKFHFNRRSHDKILVVDGHFPAKAAVMTGGRNISLDYYGIKEDGSRDPTAFRDTEIFIRAAPVKDDTLPTIGSVSEIYYTLLMLHKGNKRLYPIEDDDLLDEFDSVESVYQSERTKSQESLAFVKNIPAVQAHWNNMPQYTSRDFRTAEVRLAHQISNLTSSETTTNVQENIRKNPNSILYLIHQLGEKKIDEGLTGGTLRIISPYLFIGKYVNEDGEVVYDGAKQILDLLKDNPDVRIEIVTNSVMTSDNFFTQAIIDMEMAPRLLLSPEMQKVWRSKAEKGELNPEFVESEEWKKQIDHPQIFIYETGKADSVLLGGSTYYGKLHAKFILGEDVGFIGTSNFDYRSNLYNNELGFFFRSPELREDAIAVFDSLKSTSYRWGTKEWLHMRRELMEADTEKSGPARKQRGTYKTIKGLGIEYLM
jgi:phosphatidylserine/phosphatidylglycerophosphate/cardiolipin synthase-like enzyme